MTTLKISLLGPPGVELDGKHIDVKPRKALALLIYLACSGRRQPRYRLATLLWPDSGQRQARAALRRRLSELDQALGGIWLEIDRESVGLVDSQELYVDVAEFELKLAECSTHGHGTAEVCADCLEPLSSAAALYRDDFLAGFTLSDCPEYDDWQFFRAEEVRLSLASVLQRLVTLHSQASEYDIAIPYGRRLLVLDPLHEPAHQALMRLYAQTGQQAAALRQYQVCVETLDSELGVPPSAETTSLYENIRQNKVTATRRLSDARSEPETIVDGDSSTQPVAPAPTHAADLPAPGPTMQALAEDEIRIITVLSADLNLSLEESWDLHAAQTTEQLNRLLQRVPDLLTPYGAQVSRHFGNGFQAIFGLPHLHEDDPERAVRGALDIQTAAGDAGLEVAIGINTGAAYISHTGAELLATGPVVNLAMRLQSLAGGGETLVGESAYRQTSGAFRYDEHSSRVDSRSRTIRVFRVAGVRRFARKIRGVEGMQARLVGRDEELAKLQAVLARAQNSEGQMVSLIAEAGVGKSRLVAELKDTFSVDDSDPAPLHWLEGRHGDTLF